MTQLGSTGEMLPLLTYTLVRSYVASLVGRKPTILQLALLEGPTTATHSPVTTALLLGGRLTAQQDVCRAS